MKCIYKSYVIKRNEYGAFEFHNQWDGEVTPAGNYDECIEMIDDLTKEETKS